jgi:O-antigen/teichoic acid export membrane protein
VGVAELSSTEQQALDIAADPTDVLDSSDAGGLLIRGGAVRLGSYVAIVALSVIAAALLTRHLGKVRFGQYTTVLSLTLVVSTITDAGMSVIGTREFAVREGEDRDALMRDLLGLRVMLTLLGAVLATAFALAAGYDEALVLGTVAASLGNVAVVVQHTYTIPLSAALRIGAISLMDLARTALSVVAVVALVAAGAGVLPLLAVTLVATLLVIPPTAALARSQISLRMGLRPRRWGALLKLTVSYSLATAVGVLYIYTAQILTSFVASPVQSGLFAASFRVFIVTAAIPGLLVSGTLPLLARSARDDRERLAYALQKIFEVSLILGVAAAIGMLAGAQFVIHVVAGPEYAASAGVLRIQGLAMIASFALAGWSFALLSLKRYRSVLVVNATAFLVSVVMTLVLAGTYGARGAALATICGEAALALGSLAALVRSHPELRPEFAIVWKVAVAGVPAALLALLVDLPSLVLALLAMALYGLLVMLTRAMPPELIELLPRPRRRRAAGG